MIDKKTTRIGWIGLGKMGSPMASNLLAIGFPMTVYNRSPDPYQHFIDRGARVAPTVSALGAECDVVISMISDDAALQSVTFGADGLFWAARPETVFIDMSTVSPSLSKLVAEKASEHGIHYLRAPVSGSTAAATAAALTIFVSGPQEQYERCLPILQALGKKLYFLGAAEQARYLKLAINSMVGVTAAMLGEALALGERGGVDWRQMIEIINNSVVASPLINYKAEMLEKRSFAPMFTASQMAKDFDLALDAGRQGNVPMPVTAISRQFLAAMVASGRGDLDFMAYVTLLEELSGLRQPDDQTQRGM